MSNHEESDRIWIGDLDGYISIDGINESNRREAEEKARDREFDTIGDISLLGGKVVYSDSLQYTTRGPSEWRWAVHQAEITLGAHATGLELERELVRALIDLGRAYAIRRYARWEKILHSSALTASLPYGFNALLFQYLDGQGLLSVTDCRERVWSVLKAASNTDDVVAYQRTSSIQKLIHNLAAEAYGSSGPTSLSRGATKTMLSLARLRYSVDELRFQSFNDVAKLMAMYALQREAAKADVRGYRVSGQNIPDWRLRHLRPLTDLFPYSIRDSLERGIRHITSGRAIERLAAVNELAMAHSSLLLTRRRHKAS